MLVDERSSSACHVLLDEIDGKEKTQREQTVKEDGGQISHEIWPHLQPT